MPWPLRRAKWCHEYLWPGDLAEDAAKSALAEYHRDFGVVRLREAIGRYQQGVDQRRQRNHRLLASTLAGYANAVWTQYMQRKDDPDDLEKAITLGREAAGSPRKTTPTRTAFVYVQVSPPVVATLAEDGLLCNMVGVLLQVLSPTSRPGSSSSSYDSGFLESDET